MDSEWTKNMHGLAGARARRRRAFHLDRIAAAPVGSQQQESAVLAWLRAELASGGSLDEVQDLADLMNLRSE